MTGQDVGARRSDDASREADGRSHPFPTTSWSVVRVAAGNEPEQARAALLTLAQRYRGPVQAHLLREGYTEEEADLLATRFFEALGSTSLLRSAADAKKSFREWLLGALRDFVRSDPDPSAPPPARPPSDASASNAEVPPIMPGYELLEVIGRGGEGLVYRAYDSRGQRHVAVKVLYEKYARDPEVVERFRKSVALACLLEHPNLVRVYDRGTSADGRPYYVMPLIVGGTLADRQRQERFREPEPAARLVIKIARAVHHAHHRGILHRDISPANVLLDLNDEPYVCDFMAKRIVQTGPASAVGKFAYAAPELAVGEGGTVEAEVYGLAAILYELLTGKAPIRAASFAEVREQHAAGEPKPPRSLVPTIPKDLSDVCHTALSREPAARHGSAAALADDLERVLRSFPPQWPKPTRWRRIQLWARRHPLLAVGASLGAALMFVADGLTIASVQAQRVELEAATLHANAALASAQAHAVLTLFERLAAESAHLAAVPEVQSVAEAGQARTAVPVLMRSIERTKSFDSGAIFSRDGRMLARFPEPPAGRLGTEFRFRDYYRCIETLVGLRAAGSESQVCVSPTYRGEISGRIEFTVASPIRAGSGDFVGFVLLSKHAKNTLEEIEIDDVYQSGQTTTLFGVRGRDRGMSEADAARRRGLTAIAHPSLSNREERALGPELSRKLLDHFGDAGPPGMQLRPVRTRPWEEPNYVDPVTGDRRLGGFAAVGATGFVVSVSTPLEKALSANERHIARLWWCAALLNLGFALLGGAALWASLRDGAPGSRG
jgi:tRNA A-37 threonylcarbamoyl transferase component Bud32